ncbi:DUF6114 domain-containing protein [Streptomyces purpurogeneiscleroticus]|uniref:DUF6114 domain-containing protein n=1 Tax=Streptomyces purpurogeneiscleroticus TaxID=68259 RepID=UPI001CBB42E9|nr:DUF6114 domain-containing protein [Streptomyces purpurogeneiscleroticus]MBZ4020619.1 hypothetical protein [Streptomyces purpurogeneiscleroticus]
MSADTRPRLSETIGRQRRSFRVWRGQRPYWAGLLTLLAGFPIMYIPYANLTIGSLTVRMATTAGAGSLIIGVLLVVLGLTMWFQPASRVFAGVAAILLSLVSLVVSNFGAFLIGFLLGLIGGALAVSWAPGKPAPATSSTEDTDGGPGRAGDGPDGGFDPFGDGRPAAAGAGGSRGVLDDLSGKSPTNGTNGRHRAG